MSKLLELAERCQKAEGPDRELDAQISASLKLDAVPSWASTWAGDWRADADGSVRMLHANGMHGPWFKAREWTASLDAAKALVPEGFWFRLLGGGTAMAEAQCAAETKPGRTSCAASEALALCAAALKARATQEQPE